MMITTMMPTKMKEEPKVGGGPRDEMKEIEDKVARGAAPGGLEDG